MIKKSFPQIQPQPEDTNFIDEIAVEDSSLDEDEREEVFTDEEFEESLNNAEIAQHFNNWSSIAFAQSPFVSFDSAYRSYCEDFFRIDRFHNHPPIKFQHFAQALGYTEQAFQQLNPRFAVRLDNVRLRTLDEMSYQRKMDAQKFEY